MRRLRFVLAVVVALAGLHLHTPTCLGQPLASVLPPVARAALIARARNDSLPAWQRDFMLAVAGDRVQDVLRATGDSAAVANGAWHQLPPPDSRYLHAAVYDPVHGRMVVFGGYSRRDLMNDVWVLSLSGAPSWTQIQPTGTPPSPRHLMSAIYDPARDRIVVFGGFDRAFGYRDDVWALSLGSLPAWTRLGPLGVGPAPRAHHSAVYDPRRNRMIVFGGYHAAFGSSPAGPANDAWALSLSGPPAWTRLATQGAAPSARYDQSAVYDPVRDRVVIFGGFDGTTRLADAWSLTLSGQPRWREIRPDGPLPAARIEHAAIYDPVAECMVIFGGQADGGVSDAWALSLRGRAEWTRIMTSPEPGQRWGHSAIYDPTRRRMLVFGGTTDGFALSGEVWALSLSQHRAWTDLTPPGAPPSLRWGECAVYDSVGNRMLMFGGYDGQRGMLNEVWALSLTERPVWAQLRPVGMPPSPREGCSAVYDPVRNRMLVYGGSVGLPTMSGELWALSLTGPAAWTLITPAGAAPAARCSHTAIYDAAHDRMVVFAGISASDYLSDVWVLSLAPEPTWAQLEPTGQAPGRRFEHSAIYDPVRHRMIVYGGLDQLWVCDDLWGLSLDGPPVWGPIQTTGARPPAAAAHQAIYDPVRDRMILSGGYGYIVSPSSQSWALSLASPAWTLLAPAGPAPLGLSYHVAIDDPRNDQMVVFDGDGFDESWEMRWGAPASRAMTPLSGSRLDDVEASAPRIVPNPAHGDVAIGFALARGRELTVRIYDVAGRSVCTLVNGYQPAGPATFRWDRRTTAGALAPPGLYFCVVRTNERASVERFVLIP